MLIPTILRAAALLSGLMGTAAVAMPVQFTYTSNPIDDAVLAAHYEEWEIAYLKAHYWTSWFADAAALGQPLHRAEVVLEVDCDIQGGVYDCGRSDDGYVAINGHWFPSSSGDVTVQALDGFTEGVLTGFKFAVGASGVVEEWHATGSEFGMVGDFQLDITGDKYAFDVNLDNLGHSSSEFYCNYTYGVWTDFLNPGHCENGEAIDAFSYGLQMDLGIGTWSMQHAGLAQTSAELFPAPLPGGMPLVLGAAGMFALLRNRRRGRGA